MSLSLLNNCFDLYFTCSLSGNRDQRAADRLAIHGQADGAARPGPADGNLVGHAAVLAGGTEAFPAAGDHRLHAQPIQLGADAEDPLADGHVVPGARAGEPGVLGLAVGGGLPAAATSTATRVSCLSV